MSIFALAYNLEYNSFDLNKSKKVIRIPFNKPCIVTTHYQVAKKNTQKNTQKNTLSLTKNLRNAISILVTVTSFV